MKAAASGLQPVKSESLSAQVVVALRTAIFSGRLAPGQTLRELHLARELGVSQATVREALGQLERTGLVVRTPNIGTEVTRLSPEEVLERVELRMLLEERALTQAAPRMDGPAFDTLVTLLGSLTRATRQNEYFEQAQADLAFHRFIWERSGNRTLYTMLDQLSVPLFAFVSIVRGMQRENLADVVESHEGLVEALRSGERAAIRKALRQHFEYGFPIAARE
jgi:DNA-binding GntR family transcriptional regulator